MDTVDVSSWITAQVSNEVRSIARPPVNCRGIDGVVEVSPEPVLVTASERDLPPSAHMLIFDLGVVRSPLPLRHLHRVGPAFRLAIHILEVIERTHIEIAPRLVIPFRAEVHAGVGA